VIWRVATGISRREQERIEHHVACEKTARAIPVRAGAYSDRLVPFVRT
jgi:hypothetical protein